MSSGAVAFVAQRGVGADALSVAAAAGGALALGEAVARRAHRLEH